MSLVPIIMAYSLPGDIVHDAFCGSASTCAAALLTGRRYIRIEMNDEFQQAATRMERVKVRIAARRSCQEFIPTSR
jgi:site-specific DNA-methyltransferase (adenine-specific)